MNRKSKTRRLVILIYSSIIILSIVLLRLGEFSLFYSSKIPVVLLVIAAAAFGVGWYISHSTNSTVVDYRTIQKLNISRREYEVLQYLDEEMTNNAIADQLYISESAVKKHVSQLLKKVDAADRKELIQKARTKGILPTKLGF